MEIKIEKNEEPKEYKIMHCVVPEKFHTSPQKGLEISRGNGGDFKVAHWRASIVVGQEKHW